MAISVDTVYKTVLSILNKESRGFLTPEEFNKIGVVSGYTPEQIEEYHKYILLCKTLQDQNK